MSVPSKLRRRVLLVASLAAWPLWLTACEEESPLGVGDRALPGEPITVEVTVPWSTFASDLEVFGGYGSAVTLSEGVLANQFEGTLDARTLLRFSSYPRTATVRDSTGTNRPDSDLTYIGGRLVTYFDRGASTNGSTPVSLAVGRLEQEWHPRSAGWDLAVDTVNDARPWTEPGAGPVVALDTTVWDPATGDSAFFDLDSATIAAWSDTTELASGARIEIIDPGHRLSMAGAVLRLDVRPSLDPDTVIELEASVRAVTFIYTPEPAAPVTGARVGGTPSWRTVLDVSIPETLDGIPDFCARVTCPHTLTPVQISYAALVLTTAATEPAFVPTDSIRVDVRPVFDRSAMPKSPLGESLIEGSLGRGIAPEAFGSATGQRVEVPFTTFARNVLRGEDDAGNPPPGTLALLSVLEPFSLAFGSFVGPGEPGEPYLRLILTIGPPVELP